MGLLVWGVVLQALVADGRQVDRLVRQPLRGDLLRAERVDLAQATGAACGPITYTVGGAPSAIWRDRVLMRCGPEPGALDGLTNPNLAAALEPDGLLHLRLRQEFEPSGGGTQRIETEARMGAMF